MATVRSLTQQLQTYVGQNRTLVLRVAVVLGVLASSGLAAILAIKSETLALLVLALPFGVMAVMFLLRWPDWGFPLVVISSLLVPFSLGTGRQTGINSTILLVVFLIGLWCLDALTRQHSVGRVRSRTFPPLIALMVVSVLSLGFGQLNWLPTAPASLNAQIGGLAIFILSPAAFLLAAHRMRDIRSLQWMLWIFIILGGLFVLGLLVPSLKRLALRTYQRAVLDAMFWTWIVAHAFSQCYLNRKLPWFWRIVFGLVAASAFYFTIVVRQSWTSGWLPAFVAVVVIVVVTRPKLILVGALLGVVAAVFQAQAVEGVLMGGDNEYSLMTRLEAWGILWEIIKLNPLLGLGPANYYWYTPLFPILGYAVSFNSHNNYVDIVAQIGLAGLACFLWFAWEMGRLVWRLRDKMPEGFPTAYMYGALGGFVATILAGMLGDWILPFVYNVGLDGFRASGLAWLFLGSVVALEHLYRVR